LSLSRNDPKKNRRVKFDSLTDPEDNAVCPIKWILIHALRNGCVDGISIEDVLQKAFRRKDKTVIWTQPEWPILPSFSNSTNFVDFSKAARYSQVGSTVRFGGLLAGFLAKVAPHDIRRGCFQDMANLSMAPAGMSMDRVAETFGHSHKSYEAGVTMKYVGTVSDPTLLQKRLRSEIDDADILQSADSPYKKAKIEDEDVDKYCQTKNLDPLKKNDRAKARRHLEAQNLQSWLIKEKDATISEDTPTGEIKSLPHSQPSAGQPLPPPKAIIEGVDYSLIDPRLLDPSEEITVAQENDVLSKVDDGLASALEDMITGGSEMDGMNQHMHAAVFTLVDEQSSPDAPWLLNTTEFLKYFARINVVRNSKLARFGPSSWEQEAPKHVAVGNTRDAPTHYKFKCINHAFGCTSTSNTLQDSKKHNDLCKITSIDAASEKANIKAFPCTRDPDNCTASFDNKAGLTKHVKDYHDYVPKACPKEGCDSTIIFSTIGELKVHQNSVHAAFPPTSCGFPGCTSTKKFLRLINLTQHLTRTHQLKTPQDRLPYIPKWSPWPCNVEGCGDYIFSTISGIIGHFKKAHQRDVDADSEPYLAWDK
jgi:hypothetical protein